MIAKATSDNKNDAWKLLCAMYAIARDSKEWKLAAIWSFPGDAMTEWTNGVYSIRAISQGDYHEFQLKQVESEVTK